MHSQLTKVTKIDFKMRKFRNAYLLDDLTLLSDSFQHNFTAYIKKPKNLVFTLKNRFFGALGVLTGRLYPIYFAEDFLKEKEASS